MNQSIDIGKAITFYAEDEKWLEKLGIGTALVLISSILSVVLVGLLGFFILAGYCIRLLQNVRDGVAKPLPEWNRWSEDLASGFKLVIAMLVYSLPAIIFGIPVGIGAFIANQGSDSAQLVGLPFMIGGYCLIFVYAIMLWLMTPGISVAFAKDESIGSALRIGSVWAWTRPAHWFCDHCCAGWARRQFGAGDCGAADWRAGLCGRRGRHHPLGHLAAVADQLSHVWADGAPGPGRY